MAPKLTSGHVVGVRVKKIFLPARDSGATRQLWDRIFR